MKNKQDCGAGALILGLAATLLMAGRAESSVLLRANFDLGAQNPAPSSYHPGGAGDVLPAGSGSALADSPSLAPPSGFQGGQSLALANGAATPLRQGYNFSALSATSPWVKNSFTVEAIVRPDFSDAVYGGTNYGLSAKACILYGQPESLAEKSTLSIDQTTRKVKWLGHSAGNGGITSSTSLEAGRWYHIAVVVNGSGDANQKTAMYINKVSAGVGTYPSGWETQGIYNIANTIWVGAHAGSTSNNFAGAIDAIAISDTALAPDAFVLPAVIQSGTGVCFRANFDLANQSPAPGFYNPGGAGDILSQGSSGVRLDANNAIVAGDGMQGKGALSMDGGGAAPDVQGYKFWDVATNKLVQSSFTMEVVCKPSFSDAIVGETNYGQTTKSYLLANSSGRCSLFVDQVSGRVSFSGVDVYGNMVSSTVLTNDQWCHIAAVVDGGALQTRLYINGQQRGLGNYPANWPAEGIYNVGRHLYIGTPDGTTTGRNFCGLIDAVAISDGVRGIGDFVLPYAFVPPPGTVIAVR